MSKFSMAPNEKGFPVLYYADVELFVFHKGGCKCMFNHDSKKYPICQSGFVEGHNIPAHCGTPLPDGSYCAHDEACHQPTADRGRSKP